MLIYFYSKREVSRRFFSSLNLFNNTHFFKYHHQKWAIVTVGSKLFVQWF